MGVLRNIKEIYPIISESNIKMTNKYKILAITETPIATISSEMAIDLLADRLYQDTEWMKDQFLDTPINLKTEKGYCLPASAIWGHLPLSAALSFDLLEYKKEISELLKSTNPKTDLIEEGSTRSNSTSKMESISYIPKIFLDTHSVLEGRSCSFSLKKKDNNQILFNTISTHILYIIYYILYIM